MFSGAELCKSRDPRWFDALAVAASSEDCERVCGRPFPYFGALYGQWGLAGNELPSPERVVDLDPIGDTGALSAPASWSWRTNIRLNIYTN